MKKTIALTITIISTAIILVLCYMYIHVETPWNDFKAKMQDGKYQGVEIDLKSRRVDLYAANSSIDFHRYTVAPNDDEIHSIIKWVDTLVEDKNLNGYSIRSHDGEISFFHDIFKDHQFIDASQTPGHPNNPLTFPPRKP